MEANLIDLGTSQINQRGLIARTVETYPPAWIVIHETLQNSLDAIQRSENASGNIQINFNLDQQSVKIKDNGTGFPFELGYLGLGGTDKSPSDWSLGGNIGVGLTVVILSTNHFNLDTVYENKRWHCTVENAYKYLALETDTVDITYEELANPTTSVASYTEVEYTFADNKVTELLLQIYCDYAKRISGKLAISELEKLKLAIEYYFRTQSYAGNVSRLSGVSGVKTVEVSIIIDFSQAQTLEVISDDTLRGILSSNSHIEVNFENKHWDVAAAISRARPGVSTPSIIQNDILPGGRVGGPYSQNYIYVKSLTTQSEFESLLDNPHLRSIPDPSEYQSFFSQLASIHCVIGSIPVLNDFLAGNASQFIAASGIPSSHLLDKPSRGGELGYLANMHLILNLKAKLNYGKQTITNTRLVGTASKFFNDAFRSTLKNVAKEFVGTLPPVAPPIIGPPTVIVSRQDLGVPTLSIMKEPIPGKENEVIALFYELVGQKYFNEYKTYALSSRDIYDARMMLKYPSQSDFITPTIDDHIPILEFKVQLSALISDFEEGKKNATDIRVVITWEQDYNGTHPDYEVIEIEGTSLEDHALEHVHLCLHQRSSGYLIQILILREVINGIKSGTITPLS